MKKYIPYVYFVCNRTTGLKYIGVEYGKTAKVANPKNLFTEYFTSSSAVKKLIDLYGKEDFYIKILHTFPNDPESAILMESKYFPLIKKRTDYLNMTYSSGIMDLRTCSKAGKIGGTVVKEKKVGIFRNEKERLEWASMGGKIGAQTQIKNKIGIHGHTKEERIKYASMGGQKSGKFRDSEFQSEMGKRGGPANKGFIWITDGKISRKYTKKEQQEKSIEDFLSENLTYRRGRTKNAKN